MKISRCAVRRALACSLACAVVLVASVYAQDMHQAGKVWLLWSQHADAKGQLWWRTEGGPYSDQECRTQLKFATTRPKVGFTKWYDITPQHLEKVFGNAATPDKGTWIACWPAPFDFDRDLVDQ